MNNALKGALLSGLVLPGLGQLVLKHYGRATALILTVCVSLLVMVVVAVQKALAILDEIGLEAGRIDLPAIADAAQKASSGSSGTRFNLALMLLVLCWIVGTVDAYRLGKKKDEEEESRVQLSDGTGKKQPVATLK